MWLSDRCPWTPERVHSTDDFRVNGDFGLVCVCPPYRGSVKGGGVWVGVGFRSVGETLTRIGISDACLRECPVAASWDTEYHPVIRGRRATMVRCADCGFLAYRNLETRTLAEAEEAFRASGNVPQPERSLQYLGTGAPPISIGGGFGRDPICFARATILLTEVRDAEQNDAPWPAVLRVITRERECTEFTQWNQGFTPKEHQEMLDRQWMLEREERIDRENRRWRAEETESNRKWRRWEFLALLAGLALIVLAAFIEGGYLFDKQLQPIVVEQDPPIIDFHAPDFTIIIPTPSVPSTEAPQP